MSISLVTVAIRYEHDVVLARQRVRSIASLLGFGHREQIQVATAVSELARNTFQYAKTGKVEFSITTELPQRLRIRISDQGPGIPNFQEILDGLYTSKTGMGLGIVGAKRLMDHFSIETEAHKGTKIILEKTFPEGAPYITAQAAAELMRSLAAQPPAHPMEELQRQNQELLAAFQEVERQKKELLQLNRELEDTNRGVVALYAELDEKAESLRRVSEIKTHFLSNMSHEFRTPLNSISSLMRILLDRLDGDLTPEQEKQVRYAQKSAGDLSQLVDDLLDLAKVEAGKAVLRLNEFTVADLFGALRATLRPLLAPNTSVSLVFEEPEGIPPLHTDEGKVSQILRNFISNALKYTEKGEIRVSASLDSNEKVTLSVSDTGFGIAAADQTRVFEEYVQVEGPHQRGKRGTGLGLPLSKKLAHLLGGAISLKSELGIGSTFSMSLPLVYEGTANATEAPEILREIDPGRLPVLIIEDNRETQFIYEKFLRGTSFQGVPARTLKEARENMSRFKPVAIVTDVLLENESTWFFLAELKNNPITKHIPVFVVTLVENRQKALSLGADDYCSKPLDRQWLINKLNSVQPSAASDTVLIIDDDEASRYILRTLLNGTQCRVVEANGAEEGIEKAKKIRPSVIFLDLAMPGITGFEAVDLLKGDPETHSIPVIIHTSQSITELDRSRLNGKVAKIMSKQHSNSELLRDEIHSALRLAKTPRRSNIETAPE